MSTPRTLVLPSGVRAERVETTRGSFAAHVVRVDDPTGHVLLVPGWTGSKEDFTPLLPLLADAGLDATAYDQRGQHETPGADGDDYSLPALGLDAAAVAAVASEAPSHLLGHSFGGLVAQHAVLGSPDSWRSLALLCTGPGGLGGDQLVRVVAALEGGVPMEELFVSLKGDAAADSPTEVREFLRRRFTGNARAGLTAFTRQLHDAPDRVDDVAAVGLPVWVGRGAGDDAWPHALQDAMAARLGTTVHVVPDADHSPAVENPTGLADVLLPFLRGGR